MAVAAASTISTPSSSFLCSSTQRRSTNYIFTSSLLLSPRPTLSKSSIPQLGLCSISSSWDGLRRNMGFPIRTKYPKIARKGRYRGKIYASLFGVGAPEALVIGVVALLVFGPKGLAEVARNLGKTLRAFQPTIRELQDVSREFKSTLEREIGLDDIPPSSQNTYRSPTSPTTTATSSPTIIASPTPSNADRENSEAVIDPNGAPAVDKPANIGEFLVAAQIASQKNKITPQEDQSESQPQPQATSTTTEVSATDISTAPEVTSTVPEPEKVETEKDIPPSN